ncbi:MAG TPA: TIGR01897 family CRISPR-associated protein [Thermococcus paralvinellae]|uniref:TIGR01897 family CRISPR-associated protein n=1 Tax=Thermococcus paralvinellae TaxID=582419 RepID=A0A833E0U2_9EURY|nr:TIGR01897 family CRISPR-associated protein [Thermococcus paralvinellae]
MKLLVVSWGDFRRWNYTRYHFGEQVLESNSTLPILKKSINPDRIVIVLPDTLGEDFSSPEAIREDVAGKVREFLKEIDIKNGVDVIIVPGIGNFPHGSFKGSAMDAYYIVLHQLAHIIPTEEHIDAHFDSTHGLNYITLLTYRALKELLGIAAITNDVHFTVYNSDPYVPKVTEDLTINVIEKVSITPEPLSESLPGDSGYIERYNMPLEEFITLKRSLDSLKRVRSLKKDLDAWIGSLFFGLPLLFLETFPEELEIEEMIQELLETWESKVEVGRNYVIRRLSLSHGFGTLVKLLFEIKETKDATVDEPYSIGKLYRLSERLFRGSTRERIRVELGKIEDKGIEYAKEGEFMSWTSLREFLKYDKANKQIISRNFLAHAGFEANSVEVSMEPCNTGTVKEHIFLRYSKNHMGKIKKIVSKALKN